MKKICEYFFIEDSVKFKDEAGDTYELAGSLEVKGIQGTDRRKYFLDLMRLSPRDLNYKDSEDYLCCVLRRELL